MGPATRVLPGHVLAAPSRVISQVSFTNPVTRRRRDEGASAREPWVLPLLPRSSAPRSPEPTSSAPRSSPTSPRSQVRTFSARAHEPHTPAIPARPRSKVRTFPARAHEPARPRSKVRTFPARAHEPARPRSKVRTFPRPRPRASSPALQSPHIPRPRPRASSPALQSPHIPRPRPRAPHTRDTTVPPFPRTSANTHAVRHRSVSTSTDILRTGDAVAARSGAPTVFAPGSKGPTGEGAAGGPGVRAQTPRGRGSRRDVLGERDMSFGTDGAASTCPGRTRVAGPHSRRPPLPGP
jgi:hypothetical protein